MTTHLALVGEQPMPVLLTDRYLKPERTILVCTGRTLSVAERLCALLTHATICQIEDAYDISKINTRLAAAIKAHSSPVIINLTGGTKIMSLAAFLLAMQQNLEFVYLESERSPSVLGRFVLHQGSLRSTHTTLDRALITADDYVRAHVSDYDAQGYSREDSGGISFGGELERAVHQALASEFEVLVGVRPKHGGGQVEIDLILRSGNQVAIAEVKVGGTSERPKHGIDQLSTAGAREYFGTYTTRFLILANRPSNKIATLAKERSINVICVSSFRPGRQLTADDAKNLVDSVRRVLHKS